MDLKERYEKFSTKELIQVVESQDYTQKAKDVARCEIKSRNLSPNTLEALSKEYYFGYFEEQLRGTILATMNDVEFPGSEYLSEAQLMEIVENVFMDLKSKRNNFYRNLPT